MYIVSIDQPKHAEVQVGFSMFPTEKALQQAVARKHKEPANDDYIAYCAQPDVSFPCGTVRKAFVYFDIFINAESFKEEDLWHEVYHCCSLYHRLLDSFGQPDFEGESYYENNEEDVANFAGQLIKGVRSKVLPQLKKGSTSCKKTKIKKSSKKSSSRSAKSTVSPSPVKGKTECS